MGWNVKVCNLSKIIEPSRVLKIVQINCYNELIYIGITSIEYLANSIFSFGIHCTS